MTEPQTQDTVHVRHRKITTTVHYQPDQPAESLYAAAAHALHLDHHTIKLLHRGKKIDPHKTPGQQSVKPNDKLMLLAADHATLAQAAAPPKSDPTIRGFDDEDARARVHARETAAATEEPSPWAIAQDAQYRFCRFSACTWQSFGTRAGSRTPHGFEARRLLIQLATDPAVVAIMRAREWVVGTLAEMDPIDDRLAEKMEGGHQRLLGYNTNAGQQIHLRLRKVHLDDGFEPYPALVDTLLHELAHNNVGPHNDLFWHLFASLKADYLRTHATLAASGAVYGGASPLELAGVAAQVRDVRAATVAAVERDRHMPMAPAQLALLDAYLAATAIEDRAAGVGGTPGGGARQLPSGEERSRLLAQRAEERVRQKEPPDDARP